ncbi:MAG: ArsC family reductase [Thauera phenolivorans]|uniref:ArsC family reductase n=1 Tax=Thauera phenolivorans TaxID=1792543 RepID=A0A7X7LVY7_9RHOO|nr:ArsC family reductase [Thauera phenolivorans]NLF54293.1 ArsC family reductase [Thauera phenolivorans]
MQAVIYGIRNCDTMKKALAWLAGEGIAVHFHDYRKDGVDETRLRAWCAALGYDALINRRGTTWRKLSPEQQAIDGDDAAVALMLAQPALIRRPVLALPGGELLVGFDLDAWRRTLTPGTRS